MFLKDINYFIYSFEHNPVWVEQFFVFVLFELHYITILLYYLLGFNVVKHNSKNVIVYNKVTQFAICKSFFLFC